LCPGDAASNLGWGSTIRAGLVSFLQFLLRNGGREIGKNESYKEIKRKDRRKEDRNKERKKKIKIMK
jgi:hypothetical protein